MRVYKRGESWYLDVRHDSRRIRKKITGARTKSEAVAALATIKADILRGEFNFKQEKKILFNDFAKEYLVYARINKGSWKRDQVSLKNLNAFFVRFLLLKINPKHIEDYKIQRIEKVKPATVNRELALLKFMFSLAIKWKYVKENPVKEVKQFQERKIEMKILDRDEIDRLIHNSCDHLKGIIILALNTGMRKGEILNLNWNDIDFNKLFIFIKTSKSGAARKAPMNDLVVDTLKRIKRESDYVFCSPKTKEHIKDVKTAFKAACVRAKICNLRFHDLRHTAATYMVTGGIDLVTVSEILGHADIKMTMRYAHPTPENKRKAVNVLADAFEKRCQKLEIVQRRKGLMTDGENYEFKRSQLII